MRLLRKTTNLDYMSDTASCRLGAEFEPHLDCPVTTCAKIEGATGRERRMQIAARACDKISTASTELGSRRAHRNRRIVDSHYITDA